jgi:transcription-repair coupling factor (superfamily II helicase)
VTPQWSTPLLASPVIESMAATMALGGSLHVSGMQGSSPSVLAWAAHQRSGRPSLVLVAHVDEAEEVAAEWESLGTRALVLAPLELGARDAAALAESMLARLHLAQSARGAEGEPIVVVASIAAAMQALPAPEALDGVVRTVLAGERVVQAALLAWLGQAGYSRVAVAEQPGEFAVRGGLLDVFGFGFAVPLRLDFFGDDLERLHEIDVATQATDRSVASASFLAAERAASSLAAGVTIASIMPAGWGAILVELGELAEQGRAFADRMADGRGLVPLNELLREVAAKATATISLGAFSTSARAEQSIDSPVGALGVFPDEAAAAFTMLADEARHATVWLISDSEGEQQRARELLAATDGGDRVQLAIGHLHRGFAFGDGPGRLVLVPQSELMHRFGARRRGSRPSMPSRTREAFLHLEPGDYVVHRDHGIARYDGLAPLKDGRRDGGDIEFLALHFDGGSVLHVPISKVALVQKYVGAGARKPPLSSIGGKRWKSQVADAQDSVRDLAAEMLRVQAVRDATPGIAFPADTDWQREFESEFPWEETEDQLSAIEATKRDMQRSRPMDRLVCGDVGFGKTEVAIRAAFKAVDAGRQVAVLVPTTVLSEQHERTFRDRFRAYPFRIEGLSRFKSDAEARAILAALKAGEVDIVIGTHRLLSRDVAFRDLGLVVVDEEQRFGVEHKQRLLEFRLTADVLTLSATPIPRTLHMAMLGLRDISSLTTAPPDRRAIVTEVMPFSEKRLGLAITRELARGGQVFWVHNRIHDMADALEQVQRVAPQARIVVGHGQLAPHELEEVMVTFMRRQADILLSTTIIESGIDIPTANTMIIDDAGNFGLSELHQLRGRVGRSRHRAYCYLLLPKGRPPTPEAMKRLNALEEHSMLGAGFRIAVRDLEMRGAGNLLGAEQSGHITAVGYEMYCDMLERTVGDLKQAPRVETLDTIVEIGLHGHLPKAWIPSDRRRMEAYRRISGARSMAELEAVGKDLAGAYGEAPPVADSCLRLAQVRLAAALQGIRSIVLREPDVAFRSSRPHELMLAMHGVQGTVKAIGAPDAAGVQDVYWRPPKPFLEPGSLATVLVRRLGPGSLSAQA